MLLQAEHLLHDPLRALHQSHQYHHVKNGLPDVLPAHGDSGQRGVHYGSAAGHKGGKDQAGQYDNGPLQTHAHIAFQESAPGKAGPLPSEGRQGQRGQGGVEVQPEKAAIYGEYQDKGHDSDKQAAQQGHQPQGDAGEKAHALDGVHDLLGDGDAGGGHTADTAHDGLHDTAADGENAGHNFHSGADGQLCQHKADEMPQYKFRALEVPKAGGGLENAHGEEQHQQAIAHGRPIGPANKPTGAKRPITLAILSKDVLTELFVG